MAWTEEDIAALEEALKSGTRRVKYQDREVEFASLRDLRMLIEEARRELGLSPRGRRFGTSSAHKGLSS